MHGIIKLQLEATSMQPLKYLGGGGGGGGGGGLISYLSMTLSIIFLIAQICSCGGKGATIIHLGVALTPNVTVATFSSVLKSEIRCCHATCAVHMSAKVTGMAFGNAVRILEGALEIVW